MEQRLIVIFKINFDKIMRNLAICDKFANFDRTKTYNIHVYVKQLVTTGIYPVFI